MAIGVKKYFHYIRALIRDVCSFFVIYMPGPFGIKLRYFAYKTKFRNCGEKLIIDVGVIISGFEYISIGDNVHIDKYCIIEAGKVNLFERKAKTTPNPNFKYERGEIVIGSDIHIVQFCVIMAYCGIEICNNSTLSAGAKIYSLTNIPNDPEDPSKIISIMPYSGESPCFCSPVVLEENVWVGLNCIIMPGVTIGRNSFVRSNSIVLSSFPENSYIAGDPAKRTRGRFKVKNA